MKCAHTLSGLLRPRSTYTDTTIVQRQETRQHVTQMLSARRKPDKKAEEVGARAVSYGKMYKVPKLPLTREWAES